MSHFLGWISLNQSEFINEKVQSALASRFSLLGGFVSNYVTPPFALFHADYISNRETGWLHIESSTVAALAGDLILADGNSQRHSELSQLSAALSSSGIESVLQTANGTFALCHYNIQTSRLVVATDSLGARPMYWYKTDGYLAFSTSFNLLAGMPGAPSGLDWQGITEQAAFCYPLSDRTLVKGIQVLRDGESLVVQGEVVSLIRYHRWEDCPVQELPASQYPQMFYDAFLACLSDRRSHGSSESAMLSGGLDSRCIVGGLLDLGLNVQGFNCSKDGWQDRVFAEKFAKRVNVPMTITDWTPDLIGLTAGESTANILLKVSALASGPSIFSGDGGGETLGFLMMQPDLMQLLNDGHLEKVFDQYAPSPTLSPWVLESDTFRSTASSARLGMKEEFERVGPLAPQKKMQHFLLRNDLRRHLHEYFERSHLHRSELMLPFYDKRILQLTLSIPAPLDGFLGHKFYYLWLSVFRAPVAEVPWQAYPGHQPCPLPVKQQTTTQWEGVSTVYKTRISPLRQQAIKRALQQIFASDAGVSAPRILIAALASKVGLTQSDHFFQQYLWITDIKARSRGLADT